MAGLILQVSISDVSFQDKNNYFVVITLSAGGKSDKPDDPEKLRTEVSPVTDAPAFMNKSFAFHVVENFTSLQPTGIFALQCGTFTASGKAELYCNGLVALGELLADLGTGKTVKRRCVFHKAAPAGSASLSPEEVGHMEVELALSKPKGAEPQAAGQKTLEPGGAAAAANSAGGDATGPGAGADATAAAMAEAQAETKAAKEATEARAAADAKAAADVKAAGEAKAAADAKATAEAKEAAEARAAADAKAAAAPKVNNIRAGAVHNAQLAGTGGPARTVLITVRHAINLPVTGHGPEITPPTAFVAVKSARDAAARRPAKSSTTAVSKSRHPIWNQLLVVDVTEADLVAGDARILVAVINHVTKRKIAQFEIPADQLTPTEQYNLEMTLNGDGNSRLYLSITMRDRPQTEAELLLSNPHLTRFEALLKGIRSEAESNVPGLPQAAEETLAVAKIVNDVSIYQQSLRANSAASRSAASFPMLQFAQMPAEGRWANDLPSTAQLTAAVGPGSEPIWNQNLYFTYPTAKCTAPAAGLVIEYYQRGVHVPAEMAHSRDALKEAARSAEPLIAPPPEMLVGYSVVPLAPLLGASRYPSRAAGGKPLVHQLDGVEVVLLGEAAAGGAAAFAPQLQMELRAWDATSVQIDQPLKPPTRALTFAPGTTPVDGAGQPSQLEWLLKEVDKKDDVIRRCGVEIIELRTQGAQLAAHNGDLRAMLEKEKAAAGMLDRQAEADDWAGLSQAELLQRSRILRQKYRGERQANEKLVLKLQLLQNAVMKKNAAEDRLRELEDAHAKQSATTAGLRDENRTVQKYKQTTREQETVIERLESLLESALIDKKRLQDELVGNATAGPHKDAAGEGRLQRQLDRAEDEGAQLRREQGELSEKLQKSTDRIRQLERELASETQSNERRELFQEKTRAETHAKACEKQMLETAKKAAKEIARLKVQLSEAQAGNDGGFGRLSKLAMGELATPVPRIDLGNR